MVIEKARIQNFRLLADVEILFESSATVVVGRNNSGKTSLTELFRRFLSPSTPTFSLEDFSLGCFDQFWEAYLLYGQEREVGTVSAALPSISLSIVVQYDAAANDLGLLSEFVIDLDPECNLARIDLSYRVSEGKTSDLFANFGTLPGDDEGARKDAFFRILRDRIRPTFSAMVEAVDPNDDTNRKITDRSRVVQLLRTDYINAQRTLDETRREGNVLGRIVEALFLASESSSNEADRQIAEDLRAAVALVEGEIRDTVTTKFDGLLPAFQIFGYPGLPDPALKTETSFDVEALLQNHTRVRYASPHGISLPESYNGLGSRNLIYILLRLLEFFKAYDGAAALPGVHLIFIEEPEAHLHPQMQEVFIAQIGKIAGAFATVYGSTSAWPVQFVVTTHSPHMANRAAFRAMRYFLAAPLAGAQGIFRTIVKDLRRGFKEIPPEDEEFLHKYMTLTRCDLLFADKAILVEGLTERLLLPVMCQVTDLTVNEENRKLTSQYLSLIEVGGAYAYLFFPLLEFLELKTLVVTDLDAVENVGGKACTVSKGTTTSNASIREWFGADGSTLPGLLSVPTATKQKGNVRIAYQVPEDGSNDGGRSFEDAFMLANRPLFGLPDEGSDLEDLAHQKAAGVKKSEFALRYALKDKDWEIPRYIREGLDWLREDTVVESDLLTPVAQTHVDQAIAAEVLNG